MNDAKLIDVIKKCADPLYMIKSEEEKVQILKELLGTELSASPSAYVRAEEPPREVVTKRDESLEKYAARCAELIKRLAVTLVRDSNLPETAKRFTINGILQDRNKALDIAEQARF